MNDLSSGWCSGDWPSGWFPGRSPRWSPGWLDGHWFNAPGWAVKSRRTTNTVGGRSQTNPIRECACRARYRIRTAPRAIMPFRTHQDIGIRRSAGASVSSATCASRFCQSSRCTVHSRRTYETRSFVLCALVWQVCSNGTILWTPRVLRTVMTLGTNLCPHEIFGVAIISSSANSDVDLCLRGTFGRGLGGGSARG